MFIDLHPNDMGLWSEKCLKRSDKPPACPSWTPAACKNVTRDLGGLLHSNNLRLKPQRMTSERTYLYQDAVPKGQSLKDDPGK